MTLAMRRIQLFLGLMFVLTVSGCGLDLADETRAEPLTEELGRPIEGDAFECYAYNEGSPGIRYVFAYPETLVSSAFEIPEQTRRIQLVRRGEIVEITLQERGAPEDKYQDIGIPEGSFVWPILSVIEFGVSFGDLKPAPQEWVVNCQEKTASVRRNARIGRGPNDR